MKKFILSDNEIRRLPFRSRGLVEFNKYFQLFDTYLNRNETEKIKILEIGCGFGQLLFDLYVTNKDSFQLYGLNIEKDSVSIDRTLRVAKHLNKVSVNYRLPEKAIEFKYCDVGQQIPYPDNYFDLIVSQNALIYVKDKAKAIEECNRVLMPEGIGLFWTGFEIYDAELGYWSTWEVCDGDNRIPLNNFFSDYSNIEYITNPLGSTLMKLKKAPVLNFNLSLFSSEDLEVNNEDLYGSFSKYSKKISGSNENFQYF